MPDDDGQVALRLLWIDLDETPIYMANQFIGQVEGDSVVVSIGCASPPVIIGNTMEERREQAENIGYVPVRPIARVNMTRASLVTFMAYLTDTLNNFDNRPGGQGGGL